MSKTWTYFVTIMFLEETHTVLSLEKLCEDHGQTYHWSSDQKSYLFKKGKRIDYNISNYVSFVLTDLSTSSCTTSTSSSSSSSSQDSVFDFSRYIENPVHERNESTNEKLWRNPLLKRKQKYKWRTRRSTKRSIARLAELTGGFQKNLVDESRPSESRRNPASKDQDASSSSRELSIGSRAKVESDSVKHSVYTHFAKDPNCDTCLKTKITRTSCRRRAGTVVPKEEICGYLLTADHNILSGESESRYNHRKVLDVQDLTAQWLQSYPCKRKTSKKTQKSLMKFLEPTRKSKVIYTDNSLEFGKSCTSTSHRSE